MFQVQAQRPVWLQCAEAMARPMVLGNGGYVWHGDMGGLGGWFMVDVDLNG